MAAATLPLGACVGTSGWSYPEWAETFYSGVPRKHWLAHYAARFNALEINASFYHHFKRSTYQGWREQTPDHFRFAVKAHRHLTHVKRLDFEEESLALQRDAAAGLGDKLAVVLWQLPARMACDMGRLQGFVGRLRHWPGPRHAVEFRHPSWFTEDVAALLARHRIAVCQSDAADWPLWEAVTTDLVFVRLHGHTATYESEYGRRGLRPWAEHIRAWLAEGRRVHAYFDNTAAGHALRDAQQLMAMLA